MNEVHRKVTADHLSRDAYLYVRQSTVRQVYENTESTRRQYALREGAVALGWPAERVVVIDTDLGQSGADRDRDGFQRLVAEVGMGRAGIVLGLEVSRLARNSTDSHRLLEISALSDTLILDEDGIYDPGDFNDRLLLGLKGTMSEAELHMLHARLRGGLLNQARRGALKVPLPVGLVYDPLDRVALDPDAQVQRSLRMLFDTFARTGSATATVRHFRGAGLLFPRRLRGGARKGELHWQPLEHSRVLQVLHNPRYAGAYAFGRSRQRRRRVAARADRRVDGPAAARASRLHRMESLRGQSTASTRQRAGPRRGPSPRSSPRGAGAAAGSCPVRRLRAGHDGPLSHPPGSAGSGLRLPARRHPDRGRQVPVHTRRRRRPRRRRVAGGTDDARHADRGAQGPGRTGRARRRGRCLARRDRREGPRGGGTGAAALHAGPSHNRLVADVLEAEWNARLRALDDARRELEQRRAEDPGQLDDARRQRILSLATDFPRLWNDLATPDRERKRMARLLIDDITLTRGAEIALGVRLRGGATRALRLAPELPAGQRYRTPECVVAQIDNLLDSHTDAETAALLNESGLCTGHGVVFRPRRVQAIRREYRLSSRYERLRARGLLTVSEAAAMLDVSTHTVKKWHHHGLLRAHRYNDKNECLYEPPGDQPPVKQQGRKFTKRLPLRELVTQRPDEVQYEA